MYVIINALVMPAGGVQDIPCAMERSPSTADEVKYTACRMLCTNKRVDWNLAGCISIGARDFSPENISILGTKVPRSYQKHPPNKLQFIGQE